VEMTYPYFFDGQIWPLEDAVKTMADIQLGTPLTDADAKLIVAFLKSLTGRIPQDALTLPVLPPSTAETPKPIRD